jgi:large subunit ribosomal protein L6e
LRANLQPGNVLILLSGRFRGKRVVFLKKLDSGLLLVTGPHKVNGVPVKRVNQVYTMTTSTKVDLTGVNVNQVTDATFARAHRNQGFRGAARFGAEKAANVVSADRVAIQKSIDTAIMANLKKTATKGPAAVNVASYLAARFSLSKNDKPHAMKF